MKKLIIGNGKVAKIIRDDDTTILNKAQCDITKLSDVRGAIHDHRPDIVINGAAKTNLEDCEANKEESYAVNTLGPINILRTCAQLGTKFVHISSGCLFDGNDQIATEESIPDPGVWYTYTKTWADQYMLNYGYENILILRPRQMISAYVHPGNMLTKFAKLKSIGAIKEPNSITCIEDFSEMVHHLIAVDATGVFNCCNEGTSTAYDIASAVRDYLKPDLEVGEISYAELLEILPNKRVNTILSNEKLKSTGYTPRHAEDALKWCVENYGNKILV